MKEWLTIRHAVGAIFLALFFHVAFKGLQTGIGLECIVSNLWVAIRAFACLIVAGCCFNRALSELVSRPFHALVDAVYFGHDDREPPPVSLRLARAYRLERRFDEAIAECERQLEYHPRSPELWAEMIGAARDSKDQDLVADLERRASRKVKGGVRLVLERSVSRRP